MTAVIGFSEFKRMLLGGVRSIQANHDRLSSLDAETGDGDHGVTMLRAANKIEALMAQFAVDDLKQMLNDIGWALFDLDGGATGPLYGSLFTGMADACAADAGSVGLDGAAVARMFAAGLAAIREQTKAKVGDKTMLDALIPAVEALGQLAQAGLPVEDLLAGAAAAAEQGALSTQKLAARFGRAKYQGERTIGHQDPGATSAALLFRGFADGLRTG
jgi:dihydroxyacetone kinase-like protein